MQTLRTSTFLRWTLLADAATCVATGLLMMLGSGQLEQFLGLPAGLLRYAGVSLLPFAAFLVYLAKRENLSTQGVWTAIVLNTIWTAASLLLLMNGRIIPTELGYTFVVAQALGVAVFAGLEYFGLRKSATATVLPA
jgi:hypothetical protein